MKRTIIAVSLLLVAGMLTGCSKDSNQSVKQPAVADSSQTTGAPSVALASQASADPKDGSIAEDVSFLNRHFRTLDNEAGRLEPTGFSVRDGQIIFKFNDSDPGKPMTHMVYSALAADLDPDSVADLNGSLWVDCKNQEPCVSKPEATADHKRIIIGPYAEDYSREAKQRFKRILLIQQGQSPEAAAKQSADSHKGEQFWGWNCKDFMRVNTDRNASAELTGPVMVHHQQSMSVIVFLDNPQEMAWRSALNRSRYLGGPDKGKLMEDYWESNFTNGAREATLQLSKDGVLCPRCPDDWEGWKFTLNARVPRRDDPTQTDEFFIAGTCSERWYKSTGKPSPVMQPKDGAQTVARSDDPVASAQTTDQQQRQGISSGQDAPIRISPGQAQAHLVDKVTPEYPNLARQARIQGAVTLDAVIDKDGGVHGLSVTSGHPMLVPAAIAAVKQWRYKPFVSDGQPTDVRTLVTVNFSLSTGPQ
jgi:TonB family protein